MACLYVVIIHTMVVVDFYQSQFLEGPTTSLMIFRINNCKHNYLKSNKIHQVLKDSMCEIQVLLNLMVLIFSFCKQHFVFKHFNLLS